MTETLKGLEARSILKYQGILEFLEESMDSLRDRWILIKESRIPQGILGFLKGSMDSLRNPWIP